MAEAIVLREPGDASVLRGENVTVGAPDPGKLRLRQNAIGVNFHDIYVRSGLYKTVPLPGIHGIGARGSTTGLVGAPEQVAEALCDYYDLGVVTFLIRGFDPLENYIEYGRHLLPLTRKLIAQQDPSRAAVE